MINILACDIFQIVYLQLSRVNKNCNFDIEKIDEILSNLNDKFIKYL